jgi:regulator of protease activity HflC (stomatin/prohibitin superfamily)
MPLLAQVDLQILILPILLGAILAAGLTLLCGVFSIGPTYRGVLTTFGRVQRTLGTTADDPQLGATLDADEKTRYSYPNIRVIQPGGPYFKWPWQKLYRVDMTIQAIDISWDPSMKQESVEAVTRDNLTVQMKGQLRWKPCERNLYAHLFGVANPQAHVVGFFVSVLRDRIATFHSDQGVGAVEGISINDLRKNLTSINAFMEEACRATGARYGVDLDAALITTIDPPAEVDEALASINTMQNQVAAAISQAKADASQTLQLAEQAVQIAQNRAGAEAGPIVELGKTLLGMFDEGGADALASYIRNAMIPLREKAAQTIVI